jgi:hypothetical protein
MLVSDIPIIYNYMTKYITLTERLNERNDKQFSRYVTLAERLNDTFNLNESPDQRQKKDAKTKQSLDPEKFVTKGEYKGMPRDKYEKEILGIGKDKNDNIEKEIEYKDDMNDDEREKYMDNVWKKLEKSIEPKDKIKFNKKKNVVYTIFDKANFKENEDRILNGVDKKGNKLFSKDDIKDILNGNISVPETKPNYKKFTDEDLFFKIGNDKNKIIHINNEKIITAGDHDVVYQGQYKGSGKGTKPKKK